MSEDQQSPPAVVERDVAPSNGGRDPGWYSRGPNPNEQSYWDGERYTETRHWVGGQGWAEGAAASPGGPAGSGLVLDAALATQSSRAHRARTASASFSLGGFGLIVAGVALMYGSVS